MRYITLTSLLLALITGCAQQPVEQSLPEPEPKKPDSYVVLVQDIDLTTGQIIVSDNFGNSTTVDHAGLAVQLDNPAAGAYELDKDKLIKDFREASSIRPELPVTFLLYFKSGGIVLTPESEALIAQVLHEVETRQAPDVSIIGHTDTVGKAEANEALALKRAQAIAAMIQEAGLKTKDITVTSHGERNLLIKTPDETPEEKNRRVEITVR